LLVLSSTTTPPSLPYPDAQAGKLKGLPGGLARFAGMYGFYYFGPVNGLKINI
jgi:hypothetical protein